MARSERISRNALDGTTHQEIEDVVIMHFVGMQFSIGVEQIIISALYHTNGHAHPTYVEEVYSKYMLWERVPKHVRNHAVDALLGRVPILLKKDATEAGLLA